MPEEIGRACYAPMFRKYSMTEAVILSIICYLLIPPLLLFSWIPSVSCLIKQAQFFIRYCMRGNDNPNIPL